MIHDKENIELEGEVTERFRCAMESAASAHAKVIADLPPEILSRLEESLGAAYSAIEMASRLPDSPAIREAMEKAEAALAVKFPELSPEVQALLEKQEAAVSEAMEAIRSWRIPH